MTKLSTSLVFFGTGPVSLATIQALAGNFGIEAVITKPDPLVHGRPREGSVKRWAIEHNIPYFQPASSPELTALWAKHHFQSQFGLVVDYGLIIPQSVIAALPKGIVNSHFSLLPAWRGPDPITAAILSGQATTGVSLMLIVPALDEGPLLDQAEYPLPPAVTIDQLTAALTQLSNQRLITILPQFLAGHVTPQPQAASRQRPPTYSHKVAKSDGQIDWHKPAAQLEREVRAYLGWPGSYTTLKNMNIIVTQSTVINQQGSIGEFIVENNQLIVYTGHDSLRLDRLKPAGKNEMSGPDFIRGYLR